MLTVGSPLNPSPAAFPRFGKQVRAKGHKINRMPLAEKQFAAAAVDSERICGGMAV